YYEKIKDIIPGFIIAVFVALIGNFWELLCLVLEHQVFQLLQVLY
ncbi:hypothetical protein Q604_UNBC18408G0002, partial [human gut metagenome]